MVRLCRVEFGAQLPVPVPLAVGQLRGLPTVLNLEALAIAAVVGNVVWVVRVQVPDYYPLAVTVTRPGALYQGTGPVLVALQPTFNFKLPPP